MYVVVDGNTGKTLYALKKITLAHSKGAKADVGKYDYHHNPILFATKENAWNMINRLFDAGLHPRRAKAKEMR